jgi:hypothetical protein
MNSVRNSSILKSNLLHYSFTDAFVTVYKAHSGRSIVEAAHMVSRPWPPFQFAHWLSSDLLRYAYMLSVNNICEV